MIHRQRGWGWNKEIDVGNSKYRSQEIVQLGAERTRVLRLNLGAMSLTKYTFLCYNCVDPVEVHKFSVHHPVEVIRVAGEARKLVQLRLPSLLDQLPPGLERTDESLRSHQN